MEEKNRILLWSDLKLSLKEHPNIEDFWDGLRVALKKVCPYCKSGREPGLKVHLVVEKEPIGDMVVEIEDRKYINDWEEPYNYYITRAVCGNCEKVIPLDLVEVSFGVKSY